MIEGVYISSLLPLVREKIQGLRCSSAGAPIQSGIGLVFPGGCLVLCARPDAPGLWWEEQIRQDSCSSEVWRDHLTNAVVTGVVQPGVDRIIEIHFETAALYGSSDVRLVLEATGRNSNLILVRKSDDRILACLRTITKDRCTYRTVAPGKRYTPPPPSGLPPEDWKNDSVKRALSGDVSPGDIYGLLEGVGPATARALIREAEKTSTTVYEQVCVLAESIIERLFHHWRGPDGPLPIRMGPGRPIQDPLQLIEQNNIIPAQAVQLDQYTAMLRKRKQKLHRKAERLEQVLSCVIPDDIYRTWGNLLLASSRNVEKGISFVRLKGWNEQPVDIPLKPHRTAVENAERYFRKARNARKEEENLRVLLSGTRENIKEIDRLLEKAPELPAESIREKIRTRSRYEQMVERPGPVEVMLATGWRCFVGRNAGDNEKVTFRIGRKGDTWFHARGIGGAHVVLKRDGRKDNPSKTALMEAAALAATHSSRSASSVVPVDYTLVQYVRKMKGGKPGQVIYTREKTLFVDLKSNP